MEPEAPPPPPPQPQKTTARKMDCKSLLIQHASRSRIKLPLYLTINHGPPHVPQFKSTVILDGETFVSDVAFPCRREAEKNVSRDALEEIQKSPKINGKPLVFNDTFFSKSILHEYAMKMKKEQPTYTSEKSKGILSLFDASVTFDGNTYTGSCGMKKEAEQIAARSAIRSILDSGTGTTMLEIIKSKGRFYDAISKGND